MQTMVVNTRAETKYISAQSNLHFTRGPYQKPQMFCFVYVISCYVMLCYVMLCYVMLCYVMLCYVMLCYVML